MIERAGFSQDEVPMRDERHGGNESGFALILAIVCLLLLTFLALTMAASTSTDLQIATNYRWSEQALYNAEAGLEVAKAYLRVVDPSTILPDVRPAWAQADGAPLPPPAPFPQLPLLTRRGTRNFEPSAVPTDPAQNCDRFGDGIGYGIVFDDGTTPGLPLQNVTQLTLPGGVVVGDLDGDGRPEQLRGSFTVWVRRPLTYNAGGVAGAIQDDPANNVVILTSEGVAPAIGAQYGTRLYANRARRVVEAKVQVGPPAGNTCSGTLAQASETGFRCETVNLP